MKKSALLLALAAATSVSAQLFVGSDDFSNPTVSNDKWAYTFSLTGTTGALSFTNSRLDFTKGSGANNAFLGWDGDPTSPGMNPSKTAASYNTSWLAEVSVTNTLSTSGSDFAVMGLEVAGTGGQYSAIMLSSAGGSLYIRSEQNGLLGNQSLIGVNSDVRLRLAWDAGTQALGTYYSLDSGSSYSLLTSFNPVSSWSAGSASGGFNFELFGNSNTAASISAGSMYADNFSITAVPEPSTYAAFAGLGALGLVMWRRRQAARAASA